MTIRIIVSAERETRADPATSNGRSARFFATLGNGDFLVVSDQPLADGARVLVDRGYDPATPLAMRYAGKGYDSFVPMPLGEWAKLTYEEGAKSPLNKRIWKAMPDSASRGEGRSKVEVEAAEGRNTHPGGEGPK